MAETTKIYQLKVALKHIKPPVWRRFQVRSDVKLTKLHEVIQIVMGWSNYHLYEFEAGRTSYADRKLWDEDWEYSDMSDAGKAMLQDVLPDVGSKCLYTYDMGDGWEHTIVLEEILDPVPGEKYPICITGKHNCPPEDCGGPWGYEELLKILTDPSHEDYEEMKEWVGEEYDPNRFDCLEVNLDLPRRTVVKE